MDYQSITARADAFTTARLYNNGLVILFDKSKRHGNGTDVLSIAAKKKRSYSVNRTKIQSACVSAWIAKKSKFMLFITFTFPIDVTEIESAGTWNLLLNNLRNNYKVKSYVWVKEKQQSGRYHYHIIVDRNRIDIKNLQVTWESCIKTITGFTSDTHNSVRLGNNPIVFSVDSIKRYLSKYISKEQNTFNRKAYGYTEELKLYKDIDLDKFVALQQRIMFKVKTIEVNEYFEILFIDSYANFLQNCGYP